MAVHPVDVVVRSWSPFSSLRQRRHSRNHSDELQRSRDRRRGCRVSQRRVGRLGVCLRGRRNLLRYKGLNSYRFIGLGWILHTGWDVMHYLYGNPIVPLVSTSSLGCAICDPFIAAWCLAGAPSVYAWRPEQSECHGREGSLDRSASCAASRRCARPSHKGFKLSRRRRSSATRWRRRVDS